MFDTWKALQVKRPKFSQSLHDSQNNMASIHKQYNNKPFHLLSLSIIIIITIRSWS